MRQAKTESEPTPTAEPTSEISSTEETKSEAGQSPEGQGTGEQG